LNKQEIYQDIEQTFGLGPSMFKDVPAPLLEHAWKLFRKSQKAA
jgi:hypothetical protein